MCAFLCLVPRRCGKVEGLKFAIPPQGFEEIMARYTFDHYLEDLRILADRDHLFCLEGGIRLRVTYYAALLRYTAARCARAAAQNYDSSGGGQGPTVPGYYLRHAMGKAFSEELDTDDWEALREMCPHLQGWEDNGDGTETCLGCKVTVTSATKYEENPTIVETPKKPEPVHVVGGIRDCPRCQRRHPPGPCENFPNSPLIEEQ